MRRAFLIVGLFGVLLCGVGAKGVEVSAGVVDPWQVRCELLMDATNYTGVFGAGEAATVWAEGLLHRSAALQYTVMNKELKKEYAERLDKVGSNWVTGQSSPAVQDFNIVAVINEDNRATVDLKIKIGNAWDAGQVYDAKLWIAKEGEFWRIEKIWTNEALYPYTFLG